MRLLRQQSCSSSETTAWFAGPLLLGQVLVRCVVVLLLPVASLSSPSLTSTMLTTTTILLLRRHAAASAFAPLSVHEQRSHRLCGRCLFSSSPRPFSSTHPRTDDLHRPSTTADDHHQAQQQVASSRDTYEESDPAASAAATAPSSTSSSSSSSSSSSNLFQLQAPYKPTGDQPQAIQHMISSLLHHRDKYCVLRGSTGTGKTFVMAHLIQQLQRPVLLLCPNKTLAAQLARELSQFFPRNAVELFVSYYNTYRPESYKESTQKYWSKKSSINTDIDILRHCATKSLVTRQDVIVVASVSCMFGVGMPQEYIQASMMLHVNDIVSVEDYPACLESVLLYQFNEQDDTSFARGQYQISGSYNTGLIVTIWPPHDPFPMQLEFEPVVVAAEVHDTVGRGRDSEAAQQQQQLRVTAIREGTQQGFKSKEFIRIFPAKHHVTSEEQLSTALDSIKLELQQRVAELQAQGQHDIANRLLTRVQTDLRILYETGTCAGVENYSRHLSQRAPGQPPCTLLDYFKMLNDNNWLLMVDESHVAIPQLKAMYCGDRNRKLSLIKHGYRLPSALDNRPLKDQEFWSKVPQTLFVSATPSQHELKLLSHNQRPAEMVIRPTFVCDPIIHVHPTHNQLQHLLHEVQQRAAKNQRTLVVALTRRDAEDLSTYLQERGIKSAHIHCKLKTKERSDALKSLQRGDIDCLVGVNLLREGLDLPQVSLVAILNADSEGFLRCETSLLQTVGRAARNVDGTAIFYADRITDSMQRCIDDTSRRREIQLAYNAQHNCEMKSTTGSSTLSIFDILQERIELEQGIDSYLITPTSVERTNRDGTVADPSARATATASLSNSEPFPLPSPTKSMAKPSIETGHIPTTPGVYFWKGTDGEILYIGKAINLRSRIKSYLSPRADHGVRIKAMVQQANQVEFVLTPSDRDALILESKLIKLHQPPFNVLLKDDEHYPYICASVGDEYPSLSIAPYRDNDKLQDGRYRYFGPYTNYRELKVMMQYIEDKYSLRQRSLQARFRSLSKESYQEQFQQMLNDVFEGKSNELVHRRVEYESAGQLFESPYNLCRDVVAVSKIEGTSDTILVMVLQLREGLVAGRFSYTCRVPFGAESDDDYATALQTALEQRHYSSCQESMSGRYSWFPEEILLSHEPDMESLTSTIRQHQKELGGSSSTLAKVKISTGARRGEKKAADERTLEFARSNAQQMAQEKSYALRLADDSHSNGVNAEMAASELASLLGMERKPSRIECYDISHTQGSFPVGSRVVFVEGKPVPDLYRRFNIQSVVGVDDYASLEEVLERRFRRAWVNGVGGPVDRMDPWAIPDLVVIDGGPGQLGAAVKGMSKARIYPLNDPSAPAPPVAASGKNRGAAVAICALAKSQEEVYTLGKSDPINEANDTPGLLLLRALRDESHRYALSSHRKRRSILKSK